MPSLKVSVVIPAYNGGPYIGETIRSVLNQTYRNLELIVVDDASQDDTVDVVQQFSDPRLTLLRRPKNHGSDPARKLALGVSSGDLIAFLDQDDLFHPRKLEEQVAFLASHPDIGLTYNPFYLVGPFSNQIHTIFRPPANVGLQDVLVGFPIPPSVHVVRREWALRDELWAEETFFRGREVVFCGRLLLAGCRFGFVDRALNYRRLHVGRWVSSVERCCEEELKCQDILLSDERFPGELRTARQLSRKNTFLEFAYVALSQREMDLGGRLLREATQLDPELLRDGGARLLRFFFLRSTSNGMEDHEVTLRHIWQTGPAEFRNGLARCDYLVGQGYLVRGARAVIWGRHHDGADLLERAACLKAQCAEFFLDSVCYELLSYRTELGSEAATAALGRLAAALVANSYGVAARRLKGCYHFNWGVALHESGHGWDVIGEFTRAVFHHPAYLGNRGALSRSVRALTRGIASRTA